MFEPEAIFATKSAFTNVVVVLVVDSTEPVTSDAVVIFNSLISAPSAALSVSINALKSTEVGLLKSAGSNSNADRTVKPVC